jgi:hypothetical protein
MILIQQYNLLGNNRGEEKKKYNQHVNITDSKTVKK